MMAFMDARWTFARGRDVSCLRSVVPVRLLAKGLALFLMMPKYASVRGGYCCCAALVLVVINETRFTPHANWSIS